MSAETSYRVTLFGGLGNAVSTFVNAKNPPLALAKACAMLSTLLVGEDFVDVLVEDDGRVVVLSSMPYNNREPEVWPPRSERPE